MHLVTFQEKEVLFELKAKVNNWVKTGNDLLFSFRYKVYLIQNYAVPNIF